MQALSKQELDAMGCSIPDCGHDHSIIYLNPRCHPPPFPRKAMVFDSESRSPSHSPRQPGVVHVRYEKLLGEIVVECAVCQREVVRISVRESRNSDEN
jgi:hypothetical protein